jgi:hypothetical protein
MRVERKISDRNGLQSLMAPIILKIHPNSLREEVHQMRACANPDLSGIRPPSPTAKKAPPLPPAQVLTLYEAPAPISSPIFPNPHIKR